MKLTTTISDSIEACKEVGNRYVKMSGDTEAKIPIEDRMLYQRYAEKFLDAASRLEGLRDLGKDIDKLIAIHGKGVGLTSIESKLKNLL